MVTDASSWIRALIDESPEGMVRARLRREAYVDAPALIDLEFLSAVRRLLVARSISLEAAERAVGLFLSAPIQRHLQVSLVWRAWELRDNLTPYDAAYVALAEALDATLLTVDARLARASGIRCPVELA